MKELRDLLSRLDDALQHVADEREGATAIAKEAKKLGHVPAAAKRALLVSKMKPTDAQAWLRTFVQSCEALGLDAQHDLEDDAPATNTVVRRHIAFADAEARA